jgi:trk system potassium uptake protein TrkH
MQFAVIQRVMGLLLILFSVIMLPSALLAAFEGDRTWIAFLESYAITLAAGVLLWLPARQAHRELRIRDGFVIVTLFWALLALFGALPFMFAGITPTFADAYFETMSGLTTTGSTVLTGLDRLPDSVNLWRAMLQFLGGGGIVVLAVAILPLLGVGGMQLYKAETPGPMKENKLTPRIKETAKALWYIYLGLNLACFLALWAAGMTPFDAVIHSFTTISTGGYSNHDASIGYFQSPLIEMIITGFMFVGGVNFALHFIALRNRQLRWYLHDSEFKTYFLLLAGATLFIAGYLYLVGTYGDIWQALRYSVFQVVSIATTSGFATTDYALWPPILGALLMTMCFFSGSAGSTAGGMKVVRILLLFKQAVCELRRLIHPSSIVPLKLAGKAVPDRTVAAVTTFFTTYLAIFAILSLLVSAMGVDLVTAFSAVAATITNTGPGLGSVGPAANFADMPYLAKWVLCFSMLLGRLELFTLLVLFTPAFWRG